MHLEEPMSDLESERLVRLILGCLLFRLGGEQIFTAEEIDFICQDVRGIQLYLTEDNKLLLRTRGEQATEAFKENGVIL
jgi:hypothetical protein